LEGGKKTGGHLILETNIKREKNKKRGGEKKKRKKRLQSCRRIEGKPGKRHHWSL